MSCGTLNICVLPGDTSRRQTQRYNLSNRCIPLVRKDQDAIILPGGHEGTREFAHFCREVLELNEDQVGFERALMPGVQGA